MVVDGEVDDDVPEFLGQQQPERIFLIFACTFVASLLFLSLVSRLVVKSQSLI